MAMVCSCPSIPVVEARFHPQTRDPTKPGNTPVPLSLPQMHRDRA